MNFKNHSKKCWMLLVAVSLLCASCAGPGSGTGGSHLTGAGGGGGMEEGGIIGPEGSGSPTTPGPTDGTGTDATGAPGGGGGSAMPPASIPAPQATLPQPNSRKIIAYSADEKEGTVPIVGESEVIDPQYRDGTYQIAVTTEEISRLAPQKIRTNRALAKYLERFSIGVSSASATTVSLPDPTLGNSSGGGPSANPTVPASPVAPSGEAPPPTETFDPTAPPPDASFCNRAGVSLWPIEEDGSFRAFPEGNDGSRFYLHLTNCAEISPAVPLKPNKKLLFMGTRVRGLAVARHRGNALAYALSEVELGDPAAGEAISDVRFCGVNVSRGRGRHHLNRRNDDDADNCLEGDQIAYDPYRQLFGVLHETNGVHLLPFDGVTVAPIRFTSRQPDLARYSLLKYSGSQLWYMGETEEPSTSGRVYNALEGTPLDLNPVADNSITFLDRADGLMIAAPVTFHIDASLNALVLFEDEDGGVRLRAAGGTLRCGGTEPVAGSFEFSAEDFRGLEGYVSAIGTTAGKALLLDNGHDMIWQIDYRLNRLTRVCEVPATFSDATNGIPTGEEPQDMAFGFANRFAYVVSRDDTLTIIPLIGPTGALSYTEMIGGLRTINLRTYLGFDDEIRPTEIAYQATDLGGSLVIASERFEGLIVLDESAVSSVSAAVPAEEVQKKKQEERDEEEEERRNRPDRGRPDRDNDDEDRGRGPRDDDDDDDDDEDEDEDRGRGPDRDDDDDEDRGRGPGDRDRDDDDDDDEDAPDLPPGVPGAIPDDDEDEDEDDDEDGDEDEDDRRGGGGRDDEDRRGGRGGRGGRD